MLDYRGARGSNAGDDFHELWALRQMLALLDQDSELAFVTVEGLRAEDEQGKPSDTWDGVDCALYFGGEQTGSAKRVVIAQLKYSAANPDQTWTIARLTSASNKKRDNSVIGRLARAFAGLADKRPDLVASGNVVLRLVSNQEIDPAVLHACSIQTDASTSSPKCTATLADRAALLVASNLQADDFQAFARSLDFSECGARSRFSFEERVLTTISEWTDDDARAAVNDLLRFVRSMMMPEAKGERIIRESILVRLGSSDPRALFRCPSAIMRVEHLISREVHRAVTDRMLGGEQRICLHGVGGSGKTVAIQDIQAMLPADSVMVVFDCYGGGRYLDSDSLRHRPQDAIVQLSNDLASQTRIPWLLPRSASLDYPRAFKKRLERAAEVVASLADDALLVIVIDAADNSVTAAGSQTPPEKSFVHDFMSLGQLPKNVRFLVTARTGKLPQLALPRTFTEVSIEGFTRKETGAHVRSTWGDAPDMWIDDFHRLSGGNPRVQRYALDYAKSDPRRTLDYLLPNGKELDEIFRNRLLDARSKAGLDQDIENFSAGLIVLPRPIPIADLSAVTGLTDAQLRDLSADLAPGVRLTNELLSFADEDFEHYIRTEAEERITVTQARAADHFLSRHRSDAYAATHVAAALFKAGRRAEVIDLINREPHPIAISDPILRREVQFQRLRIAMKVCGETGNNVDAMMTLLIGADALKTDVAIRQTLVKNPDLTAAFAGDTSTSAILRDPNEIEKHGPLLFHLMAAEARANDRDPIAVREAHRQVQAWLQRRREPLEDQKKKHPKAPPDGWDISSSDIAAETEALLRIENPRVAVEYLMRWTPKHLALEVAVNLSFSLIASGDVRLVEDCVGDFGVSTPWDLFLLTPLALAGRQIDLSRIEAGLSKLLRRGLVRPERLRDEWSDDNWTAKYLDMILTACEVIIARRGDRDGVIPALELFADRDIRRNDRLSVSNVSLIDLSLRAHTLLECLAGREATLETYLIDAPAPKEEKSATEIRQQQRSNDEKKAELHSSIRPILDTYTARAQILTGLVAPDEITTRLQKATTHSKNEDYRGRGQYYARPMRARTALSVARLMALPNIDLNAIWTYVDEVLAGSSASFSSTEGGVFSGLSLDPSLHTQVVRAIASRAAAAKSMRVPAEEKIDILVRLARVLLPVSPSDAQTVFDDAIAVAAELNYEAVHEIAVFQPLAIRAISGMDASSGRAVARDIAIVVSDAAIRLSGYDHFPWSEAARALGTLDPCLSLAAVARWEDSSLVRRDTILPAILETALSSEDLTATQVAAFSPLLDNLTVAFIDRIIEDANRRGSVLDLKRLTEHLAQEELLRFGHGTRQEVGRKLTSALAGADQGYWVKQLAQATAFHSVRSCQSSSGSNQIRPESQNDERLKTFDPFAGIDWPAHRFATEEDIQTVVNEIHEATQKASAFLDAGAVLNRIATAVAPRHRRAYLEVLSHFHLDWIFGDELARAIAARVDAWHDSPSVDQWCHESLLQVVTERLPHFIRWIALGEAPIKDLLDRSGLDQSRIVPALLEGIERHADTLDAPTIVALVGLIGQYCPSPDAARVITRYASRLVERIPEPDREQWNLVDIPTEVERSAARFLYALMSDMDVRIRWRAAHSLRRLAQLGDTQIIDRIVELYDLTLEPSYRAPDAPFYWLASRVWLVIALDRIASEVPSAIQHHGAWLVGIAQDEAFPHILIRAFSKSAALKLAEGGKLRLSDSQMDDLLRVNTSALRRTHRPKSERVGWPKYSYRKREHRRFDFDSMDTLPSWYTPILRAFADVKEKEFLDIAEHWIVDCWGVQNNPWTWADEPRRYRHDREPSLSMHHDHGSMPLLERYHTYLEWHAMFCTVGDLIRTRALDRAGEDDYYTFEEWLRRYSLTSPPIWLSDLRGMKPLEDRFWYPPQRDVEVWVEDAKDDDFFIELGLLDSKPTLVVDTYHDTRSRAFRQEVRVNTALVSPETASALVRALQSADNSWDYRIPPAGDALEVHAPPYELTGWLIHEVHESRIDEHDPLRYEARVIEQSPSNKAMMTLGLEFLLRDTAKWVNRVGRNTVLTYESWGDNRNDEREESLRYSDGVRSHGWRLWMDRQALREYLNKVGLDLIVEVEITRRKNGYEYSFNDKEESGKLNSTKSSSSEETELLKTPTDVLALGRHLVRELGLEGTDTPGRWMAHHLAELIGAAENGATMEDRSRVQVEATETILRIWDHRASLPGNAYPLAAYRDVLRVIDRLHPDDNPFKYFGNHPEARREQLAAGLFDNLTRLIVALLLSRLPSNAQSVEEGSAAVEALNETEQHILQSLQQWGELVMSANKKSKRMRRKSSPQPQITLAEVAVQCIDDITAILSDLRRELGTPTDL